MNSQKSSSAWGATTARLLLLAAGVMALAGPGDALAATKSELFASHRISSKLTLPAHARSGTGVVGTLDPAAVTAATLEIPLPDGRVITAKQRHVTRDNASGTVTWTGSVAGSPGDIVVLARRKGTVAGFVRSGQRTFELHAGTAGQSLLFEVAEPRLSPDDAVPVTLAQEGSRSKVGQGSVGRLSADLSPVFQDLLAVYTPAAMTRLGQATLESLVAAAVEATNASYRDSRVNLTLSLVGMQPVGVTEGPDSTATLSALRSSAEVAALRDSVGADLIILITEDSDGWCGRAYIMPANDPQFASWAFGVVRSSCLSGRTFTHELGHIQGLAHDRETGGWPGAYPYARGYRRCSADSSAFYDIMAYPCPVGPNHQLATFASPNVFHQGYPTGVAFEFDPVNAADGVRALAETAATVASFRGSLATPPAGPGELTATAIASGRVKLAWTYSSTSATGFKIERTTDGVNYVEIANVGAANRSHEDLTTAPSTAYSYRVAAYNSGGLSRHSNVATVTTLPPPPAAPTGLTASAISSAQINLAWADNADNESGFRIERSTDDVNFTEIAATGVDVQSHTDRTVAPDTRYYYRVAAHNAGGVSLHSNRATTRTPVAPPQLPIEFGVTNNRQKTALVRFAPNPGAPVANYELLRETYKKKTWRYPTMMFSMAVHAPYTFVDRSGKGTFRYSIRACNQAGCTAYSTPVTVKVSK